MYARQSVRYGSRVLVVLAVASLVQACAGRRGPEAAIPPADTPVVLEVRSSYFNDVRIYVVVDGAWTRLGEVHVSSTREFTIPRHAVEAVQGFRLLADPIPSTSAYLSDRILVVPGDRVLLHVASALRMSSWSVQAGRWRGP